MVRVGNYLYELWTTNLDLGLDIVDGMYQNIPLRNLMSMRIW
jgi:hypothetical protein